LMLEVFWYSKFVLSRIPQVHTPLEFPKYTHHCARTHSSEWSCVVFCWLFSKYQHFILSSELPRVRRKL